MKQKKFFILAAAAMFMAACSESDVAEKQAGQKQIEPGAVAFDVYTSRTVTRAGEIGSLTTAGLKTGVFADDGFGVFGYYTNSSTYDQQAIPNFFYNQKVIYNPSGYFEYSPVKYWPNEYGTTAISEDADKVSFFAYAPYIDVVPATGKPTAATTEEAAELQKWGINSLTRNNATGDPMVKYIASFDQAKSVDLCWGVCDDPNWRIVQTGGMQGDLSAGLPWLNVQRPADAQELSAAGQKLKFSFKHATAQLMVKINAFVDGTDNSLAIAPGTKVYVRSISFEGLATKGTLNLNNTEAGKDKAYWLDYNGTNDLTTGETVTIFDGRKDGKEGTPSGVATNEKSLGLNPNLVQSTIWGDAGEKPGVTKDLQPLFCNGYGAATLPIYVIPTGDPVKVTITYDIETADENLSTYVSDVQQHGSSIENVITKEIDFGGATTFENGKSYTINLHLGMNSVKFDAAISEWVEVPSAADVDLPKNKPTASATATDAGSHTPITIPAVGGNGTFQVSGLKAEEMTTNALATVTGTVVPTSTTVGANGMAIVDYVIDANNKISDIVGTLTVTGGTSNKKAILDITQLAHALDLASPTIDATGLIITLTSGAPGMETTDWTSMASNITVSKKDREGNVTSFTGATDAAVAGSKFLVASSVGTSATLTFAADDEVAAGDVLTITVNPGAGKAAQETVTLKIGGIVFAPAAYSVEYGYVGFNPEPLYYGSAPSGYTAAASDATTIANVTSATDPTIVTVAAGTPANISMTATQAPAEGYAYTTNSRNATYTLTVTKAEGTLTYALDNVTGQAVAANGNVIADINKAKLKNSHGDELTTKMSSITYSVVSVDGVVGSNVFVIDGTALKVGTSALTAGTTYVVKLQASVVDDSDVEVLNNSETITITVTTVAP